jgi:predicted phosphatase
MWVERYLYSRRALSNMNRFLTKVTVEYCIDTLAAVKEYQEQLLKEAREGGYTLASYSWTEKTEKEKGEIVNVYFIAKAQFVINDPKMPTKNYSMVEFE